MTQPKNNKPTYALLRVKTYRAWPISIARHAAGRHRDQSSDPARRGQNIEYTFRPEDAIEAIRGARATSPRGSARSHELVELVLGGPSAFDCENPWSEDRIEMWIAAALVWARTLLGSSMILVETCHRDESRIHLHVLAVPITDSGRLGWRTVQREGLARLGREVGARSYRTLQTSYHGAVQHLGFARGIAKRRPGSSEPLDRAKAWEARAHRAQDEARDAEARRDKARAREAAASEAARRAHAQAAHLREVLEIEIDRRDRARCEREEAERARDDARVQRENDERALAQAMAEIEKRHRSQNDREESIRRLRAAVREREFKARDVLDREEAVRVDEGAVARGRAAVQAAQVAPGAEREEAAADRIAATGARDEARMLHQLSHGAGVMAAVKDWIRGWGNGHADAFIDQMVWHVREWLAERAEPDSVLPSPAPKDRRSRQHRRPGPRLGR